MQKPKETRFWSLFRKAMQGNHWATAVWISFLNVPLLFILPLFSPTFYGRYLSGSIYFNLYLLISFGLLRTMWLRDTEEEKKENKKKSKKVG